MSAYRVFSAPLRYVQGPDAIDGLGALLRTRHRRAAVLVDALLIEGLRDRLETVLVSSGVDARLIPVTGEVTLAHIGAVAATASFGEPTVIVAVGGGKTLDTGKGVARTLGCRIVTVPTIASNDGPTSRVIALYDEDHRLIDTPTMDENPEAVIVDTRLICQAPAHFLVSGIGDAVAKRFEASACVRGTGVTSHGTRPLEVPLAIAEAGFRILLADGAVAVTACKQQRVSPELERVVEAVVLMSGLAFENGGLSLAHSMTRGLMQVPGAQAQLHGFHVAYGLLVQLAHEQDANSYSLLRGFFSRVGLPVALADLDAHAGPDTLATLVAGTLTSPHLSNCVPVPTERSLLVAVEQVEAGPLGSAVPAGDGPAPTPRRR